MTFQILLFILVTLWFIRTSKVILFWLYLWQLKEYHIGRFLAHFQTEKGKKIFLNWLFFLKIILIFYALFFYFYPQLLAPYFYGSWIGVLFLIYFFESAKFLFDFLKKRVKKPVFTKKASILFLANLVLIIAFLWFLSLKFFKLKLFFWFSFWFLLFDILSPFFTSGLILLFQPFTWLIRNQIIKKAKEKRAKFENLLVIGITGSYGKTSTKEFLATILSTKFKVLKTKEHQNSEIGISLCILNELKPEHQIFVVEMGAYNRGGIKLLAEIVKPKIGIVTGVNEQHLATFGTMDNLLSAEGGEELIESLPKGGLAIFNGDNHYCYELYKRTQKEKRIYGFQSTIVSHPTDLYITSLAVNRDFLSFKVVDKEGKSAIFKVNLLGEQNVSNILAATLCAKELGMNLEEIAQASQKIESWQSGIQLKKGIAGLNIIDASYSANPDGVISHLDFLKIWPGKKVIVMPCLIELGQASKRIHKEIGEKIGQVCDLCVITTRERFQEIGEGATGKGMDRENILFSDNPKEIFEKIKNFCQSGDVVLLDGRVPPELINLLVTEVSSG